MDAQTAWEGLASGSAELRLRSARFFSANAEAPDVPSLRKALLRETVPWIKLALERAIARSERSAVPTTEQKKQTGSKREDELPEQLLRDIRAEAVDEVARTILHEFSPLVGQLRLVVSREVAEYEQSRTRHVVEQLGGLLEAVRKLKQAASVPTYKEFDLPELANECLAVSEDLLSGILVRIAGITPFVVTADRDSLGLAIINGLRNAIEAVREFSYLDPPEIILNWGPAGAQNWFAIMDSGSGFAGNFVDALKLGNSNKKDHFGYGLSIAQTAMRAMEGDLNISNRQEGGARFELRWYKDYANSIR